MKANAGETNVQGSTLESTGYSGNNFSPQNQEINTQSTNVINSIEINNGKISVPQTVQEKVNQAAINILNEIDTFIATINSNDDRDKTILNPDSNNGDNFNINSTEVYSADIISILTEERSNNLVIDSIRNIFIEAGVSSELVETLISSMQGIIRYSSMAVSDSYTEEMLIAAKKLANNKNLFAQQRQANVDINKLNATINAYNKIIMKSDAKTLKKLAANPQFLAIRYILKQFRTALI